MQILSQPIEYFPAIPDLWAIPQASMFEDVSIQQQFRNVLGIFGSITSGFLCCLNSFLLLLPYGFTCLAVFLTRPYNTRHTTQIIGRFARLSNFVKQVLMGD